ncbi:hypothetical protein CLU79DRAFT_804045 [Phycomyces nitens]|nr:hypothetical protein CLU79DRAFT_804045 [Phycomyces nitens]
MSRTILKHQNVVNLITKELLDAPNGTYTLADGDWNNSRFILVFGTNKISPVDLVLDFHMASEQKPWLLTIPSLIWAKKRFLISKETIPDNDYHSYPMNPLFGLSLFLLEQQPSLHRHTYSEDPTVILLYQIAFAKLYPQEIYQQNFQSTVETVAQPTSDYFKTLSLLNRSKKNIVVV